MEVMMHLSMEMMGKRAGNDVALLTPQKSLEVGLVHLLWGLPA